MVERGKKIRVFCRNCKREIAWAASFNQWYHMHGMGRFCTEPKPE